MDKKTLSLVEDAGDFYGRILALLEAMNTLQTKAREINPKSHEIHLKLVNLTKDLVNEFVSVYPQLDDFLRDKVIIENLRESFNQLRLNRDILGIKTVNVDLKEFYNEKTKNQNKLEHKKT